MASITRRGWSSIKTETIKRLHNVTATGFDARVEYWLWQSYQEICHLYHHYELDKTSKLSLSLSGSSVAIPSDCYIAINARLLSSDEATVHGPLTGVDYRSLSQEYRGTSLRPSRVARFGSSLYFDSKADAAYKVELAYYGNATRPDFATSTAPELHEEMDEHIILGALRKAHGSLGRPDHGEVNRQLLSEWLSMQSRPALIDVPLPDFTETPRSNTALGGAQG